MGKSNLLKDAVNPNISVENILLRLKIIFSDLDNDLIMKWVNGETKGYKDTADLPPYRIIKGNPTGNYIVNFNVHYKNNQVPLEMLIDREKINELTTVEMKQSIGTLQNILASENRDNYAVVIPTAYCHSISIETLQIASMRIKISSSILDEIVSNVKSTLVEVIMELEKQFDDLDELDIQSQIKEDLPKKEQAVVNIMQIINDDSITIGDKNKLDNSEIGNHNTE
ncbi:hypothetical protein LF817_19100 [Halobacillus sp. A1]|uniref:AbiTii domain-containing protein n=1 Tax=Halobacillus sp. A1 TaxID=2880262 RepID=UPI0020A67EE5|nr:hypothetical protein [Halobacillus sp. A1]MCP3033436.1 hypothetical protein [Halobacillus sp. A1]